MRWTRKRPIHHGFYWLLRADDKEPTIVRVYPDGGLAWIGSDWDTTVWKVSGLWYGPLEMPAVPAWAEVLAHI